MTTPHPTPDTTGLIEIVADAIELAWNDGSTPLPPIILAPAERQHLAEAVLADLNVASLQSQLAQAQEALRVGETFLDKCNSAWSCGEPYHRVKTMLDHADKFRNALASLQTAATTSDGGRDA